MTRVVAIGMSNTDLVCRTPRLPRAGETVAGMSFGVFAGGKGANQAVAAARAGTLVSFYGATGDDSNGDARRADLMAEGIDTGTVQRIDGVASGVALIVVDENGENQIVTVAGANGRVDPEEALRSLDMLGYDLALMTWELAPETGIRILDGLPRNIPVVLNVAPFDESVRAVFPDDRLVVVCNEIEASQLLGHDVDTDNAVASVIEMLDLGCRAGVITLGGSGASGADHSGHFATLPPEVDVVDTTGAGDTFCGVLAAWLALGESLVDAVRAGVHAGSIATTRHGAQPSIPRRDAILLSLESVTDG